jgi:eukaryotic-like serine/threonine-protein kinase
VHEPLLALPPVPTPLSSRADSGSVSEWRIREAPRTVDPIRVLPRRLGRYHLFAHIGRGGMADIYLAQAETGFGDARRLVVIKEVLPQLAHGAEFAEMLVSEAKLAARLSHANVVKVEDLGRANGSLFIAMEYVEGLDLRELLRRCARAKVALPVEFSLRIVIEALRGLSFAHRARDEGGTHLGIVHRDVSPSNVLLSFEGEVKVCDFGIARANALADELPQETLAGKAGYMSPEHARGEALDPRADVFAVGIILWELLAGRRLYKAGEGERLVDVSRAAVIPDLPSHDLPREAELYAIVSRALRVDRKARYATASAMLHDLEEYAAAARMMASQLRFGEWLMNEFGKEVVLDRRARERVMRALARGPAAVIEPLPRPANETGTTPITASPELRESFLPEYDDTPSAFPVALRAEPVGVTAEAAPEAKVEETPFAGTVTEPLAEDAPLADAPLVAEAAPRFEQRLLVYVFLLAALGYAALRLVLAG